MKRITLFAAAIALTAGTAEAQAQAQAAKTRHPVVCGKGVKVYTDRAHLPANRDSLTMPPSAPVRVTNEEEAEAAELAIRERAGSVGATSLLILTETIDDGGSMQMRRSVSAFFVPSDSAQAQAACAKK